MRRVVSNTARYAARVLAYVVVGAVAAFAAACVSANTEEIPGAGATRVIPFCLVIDGMYLWGDIYEGPWGTRVDVLRDSYLDGVPEPDRSHGRPPTREQDLPLVARAFLEDYSAVLRKNRSGYVAAFAYGWPWRALQYRLETLEQGTAERHVWRRSGSPSFLVPMLPVWPGLLADVLVYAAVAGALHMMGVRVVSSLRRRAQKCTACGYDRRGLVGGADAKCPECGTVPS